MAEFARGKGMRGLGCVCVSVYTALMIEQLRSRLNGFEDLAFAVLVGSRAAGGEPREDSDWDIAVQWFPSDLGSRQRLARNESLRQRIAEVLGEDASRVDIIDLADAGLAMRALVAEEGTPLVGEERLAWHHFLTRTWRELEDWYRERSHAS